jgi:pilus assembly protein Flp/PilA
MQPSEPISDAGLSPCAPLGAARSNVIRSLFADFLFARLAGEESGAAAVEYGLLLAAIAGVVIAIVFALGTEVVQLYEPACQALNNNTAC